MLRARRILLAVLTIFSFSSLYAIANANEKNLFYVPKAEDVRLQEIAKSDNEKNWPFTVDSGLLTCMYAAGKPLVLFLVEDGVETDGSTPRFRTVTLSADPFEAIFGNMAVNDLIDDDSGNPEQRMTLFAPFYQLGKSLCNQPRGSFIGPGEL